MPNWKELLPGILYEYMLDIKKWIKKKLRMK